MNAFDAQAIADEERRRQMLHVAGILMDVLGYSVRDALIARGRLNDAQLESVAWAFYLPEPQRTSTLQRILRQQPAKPRKRKRRGGSRR